MEKRWDVDGVNGGEMRKEMSMLVVHLLHGTWTTAHGFLAFLPFSSSDFLLPLQVRIGHVISTVQPTNRDTQLLVAAIHAHSCTPPPPPMHTSNPSHTGSLQWWWNAVPLSQRAIRCGS